MLNFRIRLRWGDRCGQWRYYGIEDGRDGLWFVGVRVAEGLYRAPQQPTGEEG